MSDSEGSRDKVQANDYIVFNMPSTLFRAQNGQIFETPHRFHGQVFKIRETCGNNMVIDLVHDSNIPIRYSVCKLDFAEMQKVSPKYAKLMKSATTVRQEIEMAVQEVLESMELPEREEVKDGADV